MDIEQLSEIVQKNRHGNPDELLAALDELINLERKSLEPDIVAAEITFVDDWNASCGMLTPHGDSLPYGTQLVDKELLDAAYVELDLRNMRIIELEQEIRQHV